jgi:tetratricopeptide (TPR) repeat protein
MTSRNPTAPATVGDIQPVASANPVTTMIDEGNALQEQGRIAEAMARYEAAVQADPRCARAHLNRGNIFLIGVKLGEARSAYQLAIACDPHYAAAHFNLGSLHFGAGEFELALHNYREAIRISPDFSAALVGMGNALDSLGRTAEAVASYQRALEISPCYAEVHFNLGILAIAQGRQDDAIESLLRAIEIKPDFSQARDTLAIELSKIEDLDVAETSYRRALAIDPDSKRILFALAIILRDRGKAPEAVPLLLDALERAPTWELRLAFASCVARTTFTVEDSRVRAALKTAIAEPWGIPTQLCRPALSLIMLDWRIANCVRFANASWPARVPKSMLFDAHGLTALGEDSLLHTMLETAPINTIEFERFLTCARHALLESATSQELSAMLCE